MDPRSLPDAVHPEDEAFDEPELRFAVVDAPESETRIGATGRVFGYGLLAVFVVGMVFAILYVVT